MDFQVSTHFGYCFSYFILRSLILSFIEFLRRKKTEREKLTEMEGKVQGEQPLLTPYKMGTFQLSHRYIQDGQVVRISGFVLDSENEKADKKRKEKKVFESGFWERKREAVYLYWLH